MGEAQGPEEPGLIRPGGNVDREALRRAWYARQRDENASDAEVEAPADEANDDAPNRVVFVLQRDLNKRLDRYLTDRIPFMSRTQLQRLIDEGGVKVNGRKPRASTRVRKSDRVEVFVPPPPATDIQPDEIPLDALFEDEHLIVLNKPTDIIVHPARSHNRGTMINALAWRFANESSGALSGVGKDDARPGVVHRLDRNTTGAIVFAKDDEAHWKLAKQFEKRTVDKRYVAIVHGRFEPPVEVIDLPIGPHPSREKGLREKYVVRHDDLGKPSVTIARVLATLDAPGGGSEPLSLLELELKTGRTHQIRVHLSHLGYPIVGDDMYGGRPIEVCSARVERQALHAAMLQFAHPISGEAMRFVAPLPPDLRALVVALVGEGAADLGTPPPGATVDVASLMA